ncbi:MAG: phenylacetate-CoA oxygenase subunit PaaC [Gammaproteobacteria bacterium]|nr:phenylacetate-CoA oxygenase subunit PaaC [Gammaproteobacteria bacterium]
MQSALFRYVLSLADDQLILGHRLSEWIGKAPILEEELALSNFGLDLIGQARLLYQYAGQLDAEGRDEDQLAYLREEREFVNMLMVERPNGDFAVTMLRQYLYASFMVLYWRALTQSSDQSLADIASKAIPEMEYHQRHSARWVIRLGQGTDESARRLRDAHESLSRYVGEFFVATAEEEQLRDDGIVPDRAVLFEAWQQMTREVYRQAGLDNDFDVVPQLGGRDGIHSEHLGYILAEMQYLQRTHPGARW